MSNLGDEINSSKKILLSIESDDSEEAKSRRQQLRDQLKKQEEDMYDRQWQKWNETQFAAMDYMAELVEEILMDRLTRPEELIQEVIDYSNSHADQISNTIKDVADSLGYDVSKELQQIWSGGNNSISYYYKGWQNSSASSIHTVDHIYETLKRYVEDGVSLDLPKGVLDSNPNASKDAQSNYDGPDPNVVNGPTAVPKDGTNLKVGDEFMATNAPIYATATGQVGPMGSKQYFGSDPHYKVLQDNGDYVLAQWYKGSNAAGWFKKTDITPLASGGYAGSQEGLTLIHKKERVLSPKQTESFERLVNDFLPKMGFVSKEPIKPTSQLQTNVSSDIDLTFNLPNVTNSQDFIREMQQSREFEQLVQHIAYDPLSKKSTLRKNLVRIK